MRKLLLQIIVLIGFCLSLSAQNPSLQNKVNLAEYSDSQQLEKNITNQLFLISLYKRYKEYIGYKNATYKSFSFQMNGLMAQNRLWSQATFGVGAFNWDFKEPEGSKVGGKFFDRPIYMGWDFKLHNQFHLTTGATLLEQRYLDNYVQKTLLFNSFIGLSGKFKLDFK